MDFADVEGMENALKSEVIINGRRLHIEEKKPMVLKNKVRPNRRSMEGSPLAGVGGPLAGVGGGGGGGVPMPQDAAGNGSSNPMNNNNNVNPSNNNNNGNLNNTNNNMGSNVMPANTSPMTYHL